MGIVHSGYEANPTAIRLLAWIACDSRGHFMKICRICTAIYNPDCKKSLQLYMCSANPEKQIVIGASCFTSPG